MAKDPFEQFAVPNEMRAFAEQSVAQARKAFDGFIQAANQAMGQLQGRAQAAQSGASEIAHKSMTYAEQNVARFRRCRRRFKSLAKVPPKSWSTPPSPRRNPACSGCV
jgi:hypothetical protein